MSPEFAMHGKFSMKTDVYSFGILILEIISGKENSYLYQIDENTTAGNLVTYVSTKIWTLTILINLKHLTRESCMLIHSLLCQVWRLWTSGSQLELVDPAMRGNYKSNEVARCIHIALLCIQENPEDRPMLSTIITMLTSNTTILPVPRLPGFFPQIRHN